MLVGGAADRGSGLDRGAVALGLLSGERGAHGLVLQPVGLDLLEVLDLGDRVLAQLVEPAPLALGLVALGVEQRLLRIEIGAGGLVAVVVVGRAGRDHADQGAHLHLVVHRLERVEQRQVARPGVDVAGHRHLARLVLELVDVLLGGVDPIGQRLLRRVELVELGLLVEVGLGRAGSPVHGRRRSRAPLAPGR